MKIKLAAFLFTFFITCFSFAQIKLKDLNVDTTITGFHFAADFQGTNIYTKNGPSDIQTINPTAFSFTLAPDMTAAAAKEQLDILLNMSVQTGYTISALLKQDTTLQGKSAYYISYTETDVKNNYKNIVFNAFVIKDKTVILFVSGDLDNGKYIEPFKKTFYSIKL